MLVKGAIGVKTTSTSVISIDIGHDIDLYENKMDKSCRRAAATIYIVFLFM